jgi:hypothetical protein
MSFSLQQVQEKPLQVVAGPAGVQPNAKHRALWEKLGLDVRVYDGHLEFAEFLFDTKLLFSIVGYQETMEEAAMGGIQMFDGRPCILIEGEWRDFAWIQENLEFNNVQEWFHAKDHPDRIYTYISPRLGGLVPKSRHYYRNAFPVHRLSQREMTLIRLHAGAAPGEAIYQVVSTPRSGNEWIQPVHISERVIGPDGMVYSFGGQPDPDLAAHIAPPESTGCSQVMRMASTGHGVIAMSDYEEFRPFQGGERLVTSIPISSERAIDLLVRINTYQRDRIRFNMLHQNCTKVGVELTEEATGVRIENEMPLSEVLRQASPEIPFVSAAFRAGSRALAGLWAVVPRPIAQPCELVAPIITYVPRKVGTVVTNLMVLNLGGSLQSDEVQDESGNSERCGLKKFSRLIRHAGDLLDDRPSQIYHHMPVIEWQRRQPTTISYQYVKPKMYLLPPSALVDVLRKRGG